MGYLIYTDDGYTSVQFMRAYRPNYINADFQNLNSEEKIEIAKNFGGYPRKYEITDNAIIHYPEVSIFPNFIHSPKVKIYKLFDPCLQLSSPYFNEKQQLKGSLK